MRVPVALVGILALAGIAASANAAPLAPNLAARQDTNVVQAAWGCGWGFHPNRWGHCVPNRWGYYGYHPYWRHYYVGGYHPHWRHHYW